MILFLTRAAVHVTILAIISPTMPLVLLVIAMMLLTFGNLKKWIMG